MRETRTQHRFTHDTFNQQISVFNENLKGKTINRALINQLAISDDPKDRAALQAIRYIVNYFEFLSVCILSGNFDQEIIRKTMRGNPWQNGSSAFVSKLKGPDFACLCRKVELLAFIISNGLYRFFVAHALGSGLQRFQSSVESRAIAGSSQQFDPYIAVG